MASGLHSCKSAQLQWPCGQVLASLIASADAGFDVAFYVGYDAGDPVWDRDPEEKELVGLLQVGNRSLLSAFSRPGRNSPFLHTS